ncbi:MAG: general secretion pathway protein GspK [Candidatus Hydrogenedentes bacterium]|nr:general secretion pathway protein GspK [Candidatus Hydrogenedentota bacterium]
MNRTTPKCSNESGVALMLALLFVVLLTILIVDFTYEVQVEADLAGANLEDLEAYVAAKSAVASGFSLLEVDLMESEAESTVRGAVSRATGASTRASQSGPARTSTNQQGAQEEEQYDSLMDTWAMGVPYQPINDAAMQCAIDDEYGKINLAALLSGQVGSSPSYETGTQNQSGQTATGSQATKPKATTQATQATQARGSGDDEQLGEDTQQENAALADALRALFNARGAEEDPVDAILDWIDTDDEPRASGAESEYYSALDVPYGCKNGSLDSVEELLLVKGITLELFFGNPDEEQLPLTELLTVRGHPQGKINVNTAEREVLEALGEVLNESGFANVVLEEREKDPFTTQQDLESRGVITQQPSSGTNVKPKASQKPNPTPQGQTVAQQATPKSLLTVSSRVFRIYGDGVCGRVNVRIEAYAWRNPADAEEAFRILDWKVIR